MTPPTLAATTFSPQLLGQLFALATAFLWTGSALSFEAASRRVGSVAVNIVRLAIAFGFLCIYGLIHRGRALPTDATPHHWRWLLLSGAVGFFIGDLCLFRAFVVLGARLSTLIMTLAPPIAAITGYAMLGERLSGTSWLGMLVTLSGILWVVSERAPDVTTDAEAPDLDAEEIGAITTYAPPHSAATAADQSAIQTEPSSNAPAETRAPFPSSLSGIVLAFFGAAGQGVGLVLAKIGMLGASDAATSSSPQQYDPFAATQIRAIAGVVIFAGFVTAVRRWSDVARAVRRPDAVGFMTLGALVGPFLGVSLLNASVQRISPGIAQTLAALVPVIIIPVVVLTGRERVTWRAALGAVVAVGGVAILLMSGSTR
jgi:drug/metabolite transporter (DMT)-like permease